MKLYIFFLSFLFLLPAQRSQKKVSSKSKSKQSQTKRSGRLGKIKTRIKSKQKAKRNRSTKSSKGNSSNRGYRRHHRGRVYNYYRDPYYNPYFNNYSPYGQPVIYVDPYETVDNDAEEEDSKGLYYSAFPYSARPFFQGEGKPYTLNMNYMAGYNSGDELSSRAFNLNYAYHNFAFFYENLSLDDNFDKFTFNKYALGLNLAVPDYEMSFAFKVGAGDMTIEDDRAYGGFLAGVEIFSLIDYHFSIKVGLDYMEHKDSNSDSDVLFKSIHSNIQLAYHINRYAIKIGYKEIAFKGLEGLNSLGQSYLAFGIWL